MENYVIVTNPVSNKYSIATHIKQLKKCGYKHEVIKDNDGRFVLIREILTDDPIEITSLFVPQRKRGEE